MIIFVQPKKLLGLVATAVRDLTFDLNSLFHNSILKQTKDIIYSTLPKASTVGEGVDSGRAGGNVHPYGTKY